MRSVLRGVLLFGVIAALAAGVVITADRGGLSADRSQIDRDRSPTATSVPLSNRRTSPLRRRCPIGARPL